MPESAIPLSARISRGFAVFKNRTLPSSGPARAPRPSWAPPWLTPSCAPTEPPCPSVRRRSALGSLGVRPSAYRRSPKRGAWWHRRSRRGRQRQFRDARSPQSRKRFFLRGAPAFTNASRTGVALSPDSTKWNVGAPIGLAPARKRTTWPGFEWRSWRSEAENARFW